MTVSSQQTRWAYTGNGATTAFGYPSPFFAGADLFVFLFDTSANAIVAPAPVLNGAARYDYTVTGTQDATTGEYLSGGTVTFNAAPPGNYRVIVLGAIAYTQLLELIDNSKFTAGSINSALDRATLIVQQVLELAGYAISAPQEDQAPGVLLPAAPVRAGGILAFDGSGNVVIPTQPTLAQLESLVSGVPGNTAPTLLQLVSANYSALGTETYIEVNASAGAVTVTVTAAVVDNRLPIRVRKIDASANAVTISDGTAACFVLISPANASGNAGGWCDVSSNGTNIRTEGVP